MANQYHLTHFILLFFRSYRWFYLACSNLELTYETKNLTHNYLVSSSEACM